jgi:hypothetical protein
MVIETLSSKLNEAFYIYGRVTEKTYAHFNVFFLGFYPIISPLNPYEMYPSEKITSIEACGTYVNSQQTPKPVQTSRVGNCLSSGLTSDKATVSTPQIICK